MARTAFLVTSALAVAALGFQMPTAHGKHSWNNYHWYREANPAIFELVPNLASDWYDQPDSESKFLVQASSDWSGDGIWSADDQIIATSITNYDNYDSTACDLPNQYPPPGDHNIEVCSKDYGSTGWLGVAQIWVDNGHIYKAVTKLNDYYLFAGGTYDKDEWRYFVMCQEIGHAFGLGHQDESFYNPDKEDANGDQSCMDYTSRPLGNEHPNLHDYEQLETIYNSHLDGSDSAGDGDTKPGNGKGGGPKKGKRSGTGKLVAVSGFEFATYVRNDPSEWGTAVAFTDKGQPHVFVKDLDNGVKVVTHVTWTEDARAGAHFPHQH